MNTNEPPPRDITQAIDTIVRAEWGRLLSSLISAVRDFQLAEDCLQEAIESALSHWSKNGLPRSPIGWLLQTARRKAIDKIRRDRNFQRKRTQYTILIDMERDTPEEFDDSAIPDERLRLIFSCCHPALEEKSRIALTLRTLGGLTTTEIARAFLDKDEAMAQRLVRAKRKIKRAGIPFQVPDADKWPERLASVLGVLYLIFNEGYSATSGDSPIRHSLCDEAIHLTRIMLLLRPREPEIMGLLALMLLHDSRSTARFDANGDIIPLDMQDRSHWHKNKISEGISLVEQALALSNVGPYQLQAAISAVHAETASIDETRWQEILVLYNLLDRMQPNPVIRLNRAVAISYAVSPQAALDALQLVAPDLENYQPFHATLADCLRRANRIEEASSAYERAIALTANPSEARFLTKRMRDL